MFFITFVSLTNCIVCTVLILLKFGNPNISAWPTNSSPKMEAAAYEMLSSHQGTSQGSK